MSGGGRGLTGNRFASHIDLFLSCWRQKSRNKKGISQAVLHAADRAHEVWDICFHPVRLVQRPCNVHTVGVDLTEMWARLSDRGAPLLSNIQYLFLCKMFWAPRGLRAAWYRLERGWEGGFLHCADRLCVWSTTQQTVQEEERERGEGGGEGLDWKSGNIQR